MISILCQVHPCFCGNFLPANSENGLDRCSSQIAGSGYPLDLLYPSFQKPEEVSGLCMVPKMLLAEQGKWFQGENFAFFWVRIFSLCQKGPGKKGGVFCIETVVVFSAAATDGPPGSLVMESRDQKFKRNSPFLASQIPCCFSDVCKNPTAAPHESPLTPCEFLAR